ncbi:MAG: YihY/virulence factor BrkB family protein [Gallionellaceae bacterium]|nr:YihY/virulence factor BrkB family protein [Gallionellaceae bacterium]
MKFIDPRTAHVLKNPAAFALQVLRAFQANQGLLLAGAVAYYALLSIVPLLILMVIMLSSVIDQAVLLATIDKALEYVVPGESGAVSAELKALLEHRQLIGWMLFITMLFFSSLGFRVLESAISVIFLHRLQIKKRPLYVSLLLPFVYNFFIGVALFAGTFIMFYLLALGGENLVLFGQSWSLGGFSRLLIGGAGIVAEILLISAIYYFMPVGRLTAKHALIGGATAGLLWELIRHVLSWYFGSMSQVSVFYGSLTTAIVVMLSFEVGATLLLLGAQVIAEYENIVIAEEEKSPPVRIKSFLGQKIGSLAKPVLGTIKRRSLRNKRKPR